GRGARARSAGKHSSERSVELARMKVAPFSRAKHLVAAPADGRCRNERLYEPRRISRPPGSELDPGELFSRAIWQTQDLDCSGPTRTGLGRRPSRKFLG